MSPAPLDTGDMLQALGRYLIAICPRNELTADEAVPAIRTAPALPCPACLGLAKALGLESGRERTDIPDFAEGLIRWEGSQPHKD